MVPTFKTNFQNSNITSNVRIQGRKKKENAAPRGLATTAQPPMAPTPVSCAVNIFGLLGKTPAMAPWYLLL